ncbi:hypothetical protein QA600_05100 [Natronococcus sp. A-GB1]|uniref:hypothetical protein n=1 Tax=Natronococcus sp. A-GB1 TaxID=3037648 RepID=UPI00241E239B|nr:hypothetical protein [Natronococcus sp. A-GB1]MDG5758712.1 hypothetical protein [Natronococcus sp. A-GB1]
MPGSVREWSMLPEETPLRRALVYAPYGLYGGFAAWIVAAAVLLTVGQALAGSPLALAMFAVLAGGPVSVVALWLLVRHDSLPKWLDGLYLTDRLTGRGLALAIAVGVAVVGIVGVLSPRGTVLLVFLGTGVLALVSNSAEATVAFDPGAGRIVVRNERRRDSGGTKRIDLANVTAAYRVPLGVVSLYVCRRVGASPVTVSVPERHRSAFERALEEADDVTPTAEPKTPNTTRPMRIVLVVVSLKFFAVAGAIGYLVYDAGSPGTGRVLAGLSTLLFFGLVTLWYASYQSLLARRERIRSRQ